MKMTIFLIIILLTFGLFNCKNQEPKDSAQLLLEGLWSFQPYGHREDGKYEEQTGYYIYIRKEHGVYKFWFWEGFDLELYEYQTVEIDDIKDANLMFVHILDPIRSFYPSYYRVLSLIFEKSNEFTLDFVGKNEKRFYVKVYEKGQFYKENQFLIHPEGLIQGYTKDSQYRLPDKLFGKK